MNILKKQYLNQSRIDLIDKIGYQNCMSVPKIEAISINTTLKQSIQDKKSLLPVFLALELITGQKASMIKAKKSVATFKLRKGMHIGAKVTLRGTNLEVFLHKLVNVVLPRIKDFKGIKQSSISSNGSLSLGINNILIFPEVEQNFEKFKNNLGLNITIQTNCKGKQDCLTLLSSLGFPFIKKST